MSTAPNSFVLSYFCFLGPLWGVVLAFSGVKYVGKDVCSQIVQPKVVRFNVKQ